MRPDKSFEYFNPRFVQVFGYDLYDLPDKDAWFEAAYPDPEYREVAVKRWTRITSRGPVDDEVRPGVFIVRCKDGSDKHVSIKAVNLEDGRQALAYEDVTKYIQAKGELKKAVADLSATLDAIAEGILVVGRKGRIEHFNSQFARMWKISPDLLSARSDESALNFVLVQLRYPAPFQARIRELYENPESESFDRLEFKDGRVFDAYSTPNYLDGRITGRVWSFRDVTKRVNAEEALKESKQRLDLALRGAQLGLWDWNIRTGEVVSGLRAAELLGYSAEEILSHDSEWEKQIHPDDKPEVMEAWNRHLKGAQPLYEAEYRLTASSGETKWILDLGAVCERDQEGRPLRATGVNLDITQRKRIEQALLEKSQALELANMELEQFAHSVSHDLQQPLRAISSYLKLIERRYKGRLDEKADRHIFRCIAAADRMQNLISDLLEYSKLAGRDETIESVDCNVTLKEALSDLHNLLQASEAEITHDHLPIVRADGSLLQIVLVNLLANAIKFRSYDPPKIHVSAERQRSEWLFSIRDNGIGIAPEYHQRIFDMFHRLHDASEYPGTGIGLATCKKMIERRGGGIWVKSRVGAGSTFFFTIPVDSDGES
jgi:PAS domain S-box-containing protein